MAKKVFEIDLNEEFEHLDSSPVVEAVIHWAARASKPMDESSLKERLARELPEYPLIHSQRWRQMESMFTADGSAHQMLNEGWHGLRLLSSDKLFVVQFTRDGLVFSRMTPYHNWDEFSEAGIKLWRLFCEIVEPVEVQRLGVRFINRIPIKKISTVKRYLSQPPKCLEGMALASDHFIYQSTHYVPNLPYGINVRRTVPPVEVMADQSMALIVDIDAFTRSPFGISETDTANHLRKLRWLKDKAFFSLMTKKALAEFAQKRKVE